MKTISASKFKEQCLALLEQVGAEEIVITKHGTPVAKLVPVQSGCAHLLGSMKGKIRIHGDILGTGASGMFNIDNRSLVYHWRVDHDLRMVATAGVRPGGQIGEISNRSTSTHSR